ncbi:MAG: hypothetical protein AAGI66_01480 [Cyanobacteria bacterium P01_H01_bin.74]
MQQQTKGLLTKTMLMFLLASLIHSSLIPAHRALMPLAYAQSPSRLNATDSSGKTTEAPAAVLKGSVIKTKKHSNLPTVNPDDIKVVEPGTTLDMVISTAIAAGVNETGDEFYGKVSDDYLVDGKVVIPRGTIIHGLVERMTDPKRGGRNGYIKTRFDYMITPDGREISIDGNHTTKEGKLKGAAKMVGRAAGYTVGGGIAGAVMALKFGGLAAVAASEGYILAGGAALGGVAGLTSAMLTKGKHAMIQPGAEIRVKITDDLKLPTVNMPDPSAKNKLLAGLDVKVIGLKIDKDPFGEPNEMTLTLDINNRTENTFSTFEIALEDEFGNIFYPSPFGDTGMWFSRITPNSRANNNLTFNVDNTRNEHMLIFYKQYTHEPLARIAITEAMVTDDKIHKKRKKHKKRRHR